MGAGISAGAFAEGFYKGYSLIEKSMADKEDRELKRIKQEQDLKDNNTKLEREIGTTLVSTTEKINAYSKDEAAAIEKGDIESANAARASTEKLVNVTNQTITNVNKTSGKNFDIINLNPNTTTPLSVFTSLEGKEYVVPSLLVEQLDRLKGTEDGKKFFKVLPDGSLGIHTMDDATKLPTGNIDNKFIFKPLTKKDDKISFEEKGYNQWAAKPENKGKSIDEYKIELDTRKAIITESSKTASKEYVDKNGNKVRLTDWELSLRTDKDNLIEYKPESESNSDKNLKFWEKANKKLQESDPVLFEQKRQEYMQKQTEANIYGSTYGQQQQITQNVVDNSNKSIAIVDNNAKATKGEIKALEAKSLNDLSKSNPKRYEQVSADITTINQNMGTVLQLDRIIKDANKQIGNKQLKQGILDNMKTLVQKGIGLDDKDQELINNININTRIGVLQAAYVKATTGLSSSDGERRSINKQVRGDEWNDETAMLKHIQSFSAATKSSIATLGYTNREHAPDTYLITKKFTGIDMGKDDASRNKPSGSGYKAKNGKILDLNKYKK